jgi:nitrogen fixation protein FixH
MTGGSAAAKWTLIIVGLLVGNVLAMGALIVAASSDRAQIIPSYYQRAVAYDDELDAAEDSRRLGWQVATTIDDMLVVAANDSSGLPISGARVRVAGFQRSHAAARFELELAATTPGRYQIAGTWEPGVHDLIVTVTRGDDTFVSRVVAEAR